MHVTKIRDGMGERVTNQVLDRFIERTPRALEMQPHARRIRAMHSADWGNKYFGAGLDQQARRCYVTALRHDPTLAWQGGFLHRLAGLAVGRGLYERAKRTLRGSAPSR